MPIAVWMAMSDRRVGRWCSMRNMICDSRAGMPRIVCWLVSNRYRPEEWMYRVIDQEIAHWSWNECWSLEMKWVSLYGRLSKGYWLSTSSPPLSVFHHHRRNNFDCSWLAILGGLSCRCLVALLGIVIDQNETIKRRERSKLGNNVKGVLHNWWISSFNTNCICCA